MPGPAVLPCCPSTRASLPDVLPTDAELFLVAGRAGAGVIASAPGFDGFHGLALVALVAAIAGALLWGGALAVTWARRLRLPDAGPETTDLGPEPPAVAGLLVSGWSVSPATVSATLLDLAARRILGLDEIGPDHFVVRTGRARTTRR